MADQWSRGGIVTYNGEAKCKWRRRMTEDGKTLVRLMKSNGKVVLQNAVLAGAEDEPQDDKKDDEEEEQKEAEVETEAPPPAAPSAAPPAKKGKGPRRARRPPLSRRIRIRQWIKGQGGDACVGLYSGLYSDTFCRIPLRSRNTS